VTAGERQPAGGLVLLYHRPLGRGAATISEHVDSFAKYSRYRVWSVNTERGFPQRLRDLPCEVVVLHYSLFGIWPYVLRDFLSWVSASRAYKVAFFQDEHRFCGKRFKFLNDNRVDAVYSCLEPADAARVYGPRTAVRDLRYTLPGYVSDELVSRAAEMCVPDDRRSLDIAYRGRKLAYYMGRGAQEKYEIGRQVRQRAAAAGLRVDIDSSEDSRLYGDAWYQFMANARGTLGVESGVSIFDLDDVVRPACDSYLAQHPGASFEEISAAVLAPWENNIPYRTISPRHFEAAAFRVCQILFEGRYSGIMHPMVHYIPLKKDFSNWDEVVARFSDASLRRRLTERAYQDLIGSGRYTYRAFIHGFDEDLHSADRVPGALRIEGDDPIQRDLQGSWSGRCRAVALWALRQPFPGRTNAVRLFRWLSSHAG
jgi:hypothetical protein